MRQQIINRLKDLEQYSYTLSQLLNVVRNEDNNKANGFINIINYAIKAKEQIGAKMPASTWAKFFSKFLQDINWPGERTLNSIEHQAVKRFFLAFEEFSLLDKINVNFTFSKALQNFKKFIASIPFQAQSKNVNVQILGVLEASNQPFTHLFVTQMVDVYWPEKPHPNPFVPLAILKSNNMPHASSARELEIAKSLTKRFQYGARDVKFTSSLLIDDRHTFVSDLIADFPLKTIKFSENIAVNNDKYLEKYVLKKGPKYLEINLQGGANIFKSQAKCPFLAFVQLRLGAKAEHEEVLGLGPAKRGVLVHKIMEDIWTKLKCQEDLNSLSEQQLKSMIETVVDNNLKIVIHSQNKRFIVVEKNRLTQLILSWLNIEKQRPAFKVVALEKEQIFNIKDKTIKLRIDRVDKCKNGEYVLIDYKTGAVSINDLFNSRLKEPQLPLYNLSFCEKLVRAATFASIRTDKVKFVGVGELEQTISGIYPIKSLKIENKPKDWQALSVQWKHSIENLLDEFIHGVANVAPLEGAKTCQNCHLMQVCRIHELQIDL